MSEQSNTDKLTEKLLNEPNVDPNDELRMLSRQLLRRREVIKRLEKSLQELQDPMGDLINANRDTILRITNEGLSRVNKECAYITSILGRPADLPPDILRNLWYHGCLALEIIKAINSFHPMHGESWCGWPSLTIAE